MEGELHIEEYKEKVIEKTKEVGNASDLLKHSLDQLVKVGAFDMLELAIDGTQNLNPERKARKKIFLTESGKKDEKIRNQLRGPKNDMLRGEE